MNIVDSSGWIEFLQGTSRAALFEPALIALDEVLVPSICLFEVHRLIAVKHSEAAADGALALMQKAEVIPLDAAMARHAAIAARTHQLPMADAIIYVKPKQYATYRAHQMVVIRTPPFGGKLKHGLQRRVPHSRVGVKASADLTAMSPSEAGHAETLASVFGFNCLHRESKFLAVSKIVASLTTKY